MKITRRNIADTLVGPSPAHGVITSSIEDVDIEEGIVDHVFTDPPYDKRTQSNIRRGKESKSTICATAEPRFAAATSETRARWARWMATATRRWVGVFSDHESSMDWAAALEGAGLGMIYVRPALWIRTGDELVETVKPRKSGAPQFTGDRPATGHEMIVLAHKGRKMRWNGGGKSAVYVHPVVRGDARVHETQKPVGLMIDILRDFADSGETISDPFTGSGTTQVAAKHLGMSSLGIELNPKHAEYARRRIAAARAGQP